MTLSSPEGFIPVSLKALFRGGKVSMPSEPWPLHLSTVLCILQRQP